MADPTADDVTAREFTPSMQHLRAEYVQMRAEHYGFADLYAEEFDRALAERDARVRAEALREAADPILLDHATCSCGLRVLDHDIGGCRTIAADALAEWLRERADRIERGEPL